MPRKEHKPTEVVHKEIAEQTATFLKAGGKTTEVTYGTSGRPSVTELKKIIF